ncbi:MAG: flagellar hook-basal body complex protein [Pseudomonadota bacterium]
MDTTGYTTLARQSGLLNNMQAVANNMANLSTTGYRRERVIFTEFVASTGTATPSLSMAAARARDTDMTQAPLRQTGGTLDLAIEGPGFFLVDTPSGVALTRAGTFTLLPDGRLATPQGFPLLDAGGAAIQVPGPGAATAVAQDGTVSSDGQPLAQIGLWDNPGPTPPARRDGVMFRPDGAPIPAEPGARILQGFVEEANVNPITEMARMIEVQRAYELGQGLLDREDERIRAVIRTLAQQ